ncbi:hypothetical protein HY837_06905, partial [archaeon]|nr:hypothetical protein [archaeon]
EVIRHLGKISKALSQIVLKTLQCEGTNIFVANGPAAGQRAQHFMLHIIPRNQNDSVGLELSEKKLPEDLFEKLRQALAPGLKKRAELMGSLDDVLKGFKEGLKGLLGIREETFTGKVIKVEKNLSADEYHGFIGYVLLDQNNKEKHVFIGKEKEPSLSVDQLVEICYINHYVVSREYSAKREQKDGSVRIYPILKTKWYAVRKYKVVE